MTQIIYIEPSLYGPLPSICRANHCLKDAEKGTNYCKFHQYLIKEPKPVWHKKKVVYMVGIEGTDHIKIGYSSDLTSRLSAIQTGSPNNVYIVAVFQGGKDAERQIHKAMDEFKVRGEWFDGEKVKILIETLIDDMKLRKSIKLGNILALSDKIAYSFSNNG